MWWIWLLYVICLVVVVFASNKIAGIVDALDKKTKLSGAFLGAVLLAGVTSLPELVTSLTGALMGEPDMTLGNILGSNVFDIAIIGVLMVLYCTRIRHKTVSRANVIFDAFVLLISVLILLCSIFNIKIVIPGINFNILTPIIIVLYVFALLSTKNSDEPESEGEGDSADSKNKFESLTTKGLVWRFVLCAVVLVGVSVAITFISDFIADTYGLGKGLAGALFLGIATSLPEIISSFALVRYGNFDAAYGNIIGSCMFNYGVIALADMFYFAGTVFITDIQSLILSACLAGGALFMLIFGLVRRRGKKLKNSLTFQIGSGVLITISYILFLILSTTII